jgi:membrane protease YdiL (CAAX protease family)
MLSTWATELQRAGAAVRSPRRALLLVSLGFVALLLVSSWYLPQPWVAPICRAAGGLVEATLLNYALDFAVLVLGVLHLWGRVPLAAIGWTRRGLGTATIVTACLWCAMQLVAWLALVAADVPFTLSLATPDRTSTEAIGALLAQLLGCALVEELLYRGFLVPHVVDLAGRRWRPVPALLVGVATSQAIFAATHIPQRLHHGVAGAELALHLVGLWCFGVALTAVWLRTRNLWIAVGVHALSNAPTFLFAPAALGG